MPRRRWVRVARASEIPPGTGKMVVADGKRLALYNDGGEFLAVDDDCPHQGASLGDGVLHRGEVICPWHSWGFDLRTGVCSRAPHVAADTYPVRRRGDHLEVALPEA